jgi:hypothetical protein
MRLINVYVLLRQYTTTWLYTFRPYNYTCLYTSTSIYLYGFTYFCVHTTVHVYKLIYPYTYASLITSTSIYLYIFSYLYGHILINGYILLQPLRFILVEIRLRPYAPYTFSCYFSHISIDVYKSLSIYTPYTCLHVSTAIYVQ